ncbi:MAG TPA: hypothetical protein VFV66_22485 [Nonomuraea sp.]|nr:hypothetical protein [Nonomuraea sp.]
MTQTHTTTHTTPRGLPRQRHARRLPSWNELLAVGHDLAVRAGWTGRERTVSWTLAARPSAVPVARRLVAARLAAWHLPEPADTAALLAGELVADALRRVPGGLRLTLSAEDDLLRCEVEEERPGLDDPRPDPSGDVLPLLERLPCCWGAAGPAVWYELCLGHRREPEPQPAVRTARAGQDGGAGQDGEAGRGGRAG